MQWAGVERVYAKDRKPAPQLELPAEETPGPTLVGWGTALLPPDGQAQVQYRRGTGRDTVRACRRLAIVIGPEAEGCRASG